MKLTLKLMLVVCLFSSVALAEEGDMTSGGKTCTPTPQQPCRGIGNTPVETGNDTNQTDSVLTFIQKYLISIFG